MFPPRVGRAQLGVFTSGLVFSILSHAFNLDILSCKVLDIKLPWDSGTFIRNRAITCSSPSRLAPHLSTSPFPIAMAAPIVVFLAAGDNDIAAAATSENEQELEGEVRGRNPTNKMARDGRARESAASDGQFRGTGAAFCPSFPLSR